MIIDEKGRLFSKVNIIDLFIVVAVVAVAVFAFTRLSSPAVTGAVDEDVILTFYAEEASNFVCESVRVGDRVEDEAKTIDLGEVFEFTLDDGFMYTPTAEGELKKARKEGYNSIEIKSLLRAPYADNTTLVVNGNKYGVGHSFTVRVGKAKMFIKISGIEKKVS